jgi:hypothetical protein
LYGGLGWFAIAERLTAEGLPCPSAHDRARNRHRDGSAWSRSAVRAIITNPRYTGRQVWNRSRRDETQLLDPTDPTLGSDYRQVWNERGDWIWSAELAHQPIIEVETYVREDVLSAALDAWIATLFDLVDGPSAMADSFTHQGSLARQETSITANLHGLSLW